MEYLISTDRIDPAAKDNEAIRKAASNGHLEVVEYLISLPKSYRINPAARNNYAIRFNGHREVVDYLISTDRIDPAAIDQFA